MSTVNYSLKHKGVRLIDAREAWIVGKNGARRLNPKYHFVGKVDTRMPNMIVTASDRKKPKYRGNTYDLNRTAKAQIVDHFYDDNGKPTLRVVYDMGNLVSGYCLTERGQRIDLNTHMEEFKLTGKTPCDKASAE